MIPYTDWERLAVLEELERGEKIVLPVSMEHAKAMLRAAQFYIDQQHQATVDALTKDYSR